MALLDDRNNASVTRLQQAGTCRPFRGPLNAQELFVELSQNRLPEGPTALNIVPAERRLIYIPDIDPYCALALAATVSISQAAFLRDFFSRYLSFHPFVEVGLWAWRPMRAMLNDSRELADGSPIRRSEEVMHLPNEGHASPKSRDMPEYIYESQISVMVSGIDDWIWTAYCFVDVYFKESIHTEQVEYYSSHADDRMDPHSCGKYAADRPVWDPRKYFLRALSARMEQIREEWDNSVSLLMYQIDPYVHQIHSVPRNRMDSKSGHLKITTEAAFRWTIITLRKFANLLAKVIISWERFEEGEIQYFYNPQSGELADSSWGTYISAIGKDVNHLRDLMGSLKDQTKLFEDMTTNLVMHAQYAETCIASEQSKSIQALTNIRILFLPATLAATLFSMQPILPSDVKMKDFFYFFFILFIITILLLINPSYINTFVQWLRNRQNWLWARLLRLLEDRRIKRNTEEDEDSGDEDEDDIELDDLDNRNLRLRTGRGAPEEV
ncbi:hypothetical protein N431DRAFT_495096 [Stipitochalara longipes BDJ]|nr:hypothetical protein N431DRAFT_495096 [Stipitochalara longipes BDJ]